jgi:hypothetical protein
LTDPRRLIMPERILLIEDDHELGAQIVESLT